LQHSVAIPMTSRIEHCERDIFLIGRSKDTGPPAQQELP
jgi:hypothetical protein